MKLLDVVQLTRDKEVLVRLPQGFTGTVVYEHTPEWLEVEFCDREGRGFLVTVKAEEVTPHNPPDGTGDTKASEDG